MTDIQGFALFGLPIVVIIVAIIVAIIVGVVAGRIIGVDR